MLFKLIVFSYLFVGIFGDISNKISDDCDENLLSCQGVKLLTTVVNQAIQKHHKRDIEILNGVHLVESLHANENNSAAASGRKYDGNLLDNIDNYLQTHEIRVNLLDLTTSLGSLIDGSSERSSSLGTGRGKKGGGGYGAILLLGGAMAKMMMAVKLGLIAAIAGKALMTALISIVISSIIGLKKLASSGHEESGHQVIYAGHHDGHRRKRDTDDDDNSIPLPYRGWIKSFNEFQKST